MVSKPKKRDLSDLVVELAFSTINYITPQKNLSTKLALPITTPEEVDLKSYTLLFFLGPGLDKLNIETDLLESMTMAQYGGLDIERSPNNVFSFRNFYDIFNIVATAMGLAFIPKAIDFFVRPFKDAEKIVSQKYRSNITAPWLDDKKIGSYNVNSAIYSPNSSQLKNAIEKFEKGTGIKLKQVEELAKYLGKSDGKHDPLQKFSVMYLERDINIPQSTVEKILEKEPNPRASSSGYEVPTLVSRTNINIDRLIATDFHQKHYIVSITVVNGKPYVNRLERSGPSYPKTE